MSVLNEIVEAARKRKVTVDGSLLKKALTQPTHPLTLQSDGNTIIAELKYASPSEKTVLSRQNLGEIISAYRQGGASALSILTEPEYFSGNTGFIAEARSFCRLPIIRKDFLLNETQLEESRVLGADGVLLIAGVLGGGLGRMIAKADELGLWPLVEAHDADEVEQAVSAGAKHVGVNNRNLETLEVDFGTCIELSGLIPKDAVFIAESGINSPDDISYLKRKCVRKPDAFLVGSMLMKAQDKERAVKQLVDA